MGVQTSVYWGYGIPESEEMFQRRRVPKSESFKRCVFHGRKEGKYCKDCGTQLLIQEHFTKQTRHASEVYQEDMVQQTGDDRVFLGRLLEPDLLRGDVGAQPMPFVPARIKQEVETYLKTIEGAGNPTTYLVITCM